MQHPSIIEHLAAQRRDELLHEANAARRFNDEDRQSFTPHIKPVLFYLLAGSPLPSGKPEAQDMCYEQARSNAVLRLTGLVALALGILVGSLLDGQFGLAPAVLLDGAVAVVIMALVAARSIELRTARKL